MRSKTRSLSFLLAGVLAIALYFTVRFGGAWLETWPLQAQAKARISQWEIEEVSGKFLVQAKYLFGELPFEGSWQFKREYQSEAAAFASLKEMAKQEWVVWYDPSNPGRSALEKAFPFNLLFRMAACYGVAVYFGFLIRKIRSIDL